MRKDNGSQDPFLILKEGFSYVGNIVFDISGISTKSTAESKLAKLTLFYGGKE